MARLDRYTGGGEAHSCPALSRPGSRAVPTSPRLPCFLRVSLFVIPSFNPPSLDAVNSCRCLAAANSLSPSFPPTTRGVTGRYGGGGLAGGSDPGRGLAGSSVQ